ncbi:uncharacterized protein HD556DRAFT_1449982 [Suillus plorans]|uniref:Uncharacterized protein n=1 Tax=Suillus plorans TaxID=116603 RepID=A0A9P7ABR8_9AGAM|nr:uncharacterized protein HD556DRAFT_1449982 [Suillus plorans]KAG1786127.1 hypothetical protein HD556DRAFT_1449982 [Suillus plorans]
MAMTMMASSSQSLPPAELPVIAGKPMARHGPCGFFKWFPELLRFPDIMSWLPATSPHLSGVSPPSAVPPSMQASSLGPGFSVLPVSQGKRTHKCGPDCTRDDCRCPSALRCPDLKCATHCVEDGGCLVHQAPTLDQDSCRREELDLPSQIDAEGFGYYELHKALSASLEGLEAPTPLPARVPSIHDILTAPPPLTSGSVQPLRPHHTILPMATPVAKMSKPPRITKQLDPMWEKDLCQYAQDDIESKRIAERRKEIERKSKQWFVLNWFDADHAPVKRQWVSDCKYFLFYQLVDDVELVASLGDNITKIEVFEDHLKQWIPASLSHPFVLESECHVFIRRLGVTECLDFDDLHTLSKESMHPAHLCLNIKRERDGVRLKLKVKRAQTPSEPEAQSDDVEIIEDSTQATPKPSVNALGKRRYQGTPESSPMTILLPPSTRPRLELDFDALRATSLSPMPPLTPSPVDLEFSSDSLLSAYSQSSMSSVDSVISMPRPSVIPVHVPTYKIKQVWPHGMYTCDMLVGFHQMDSPVLRKHYPQDVLFNLVFGVPFVRATYHQNCSAWANSQPLAPLAAILRGHECAGRTLEGLWTCYLASRRHVLGEKSKKNLGVLGDTYVVYNPFTSFVFVFVVVVVVVHSSRFVFM